MNEFPTSDEEFELTYGDELQLLREQGDVEKSPKKSRKSLDFTQGHTETVPTSSSQDFTPLEDTPNTNKRTIEELFGDIDDILYETQTNAKRYKTSDEHADQLALIDHIVQLRKLAKERSGLEFTNKNYTHVERTANNLSYTVPNYPFVGVTRHDGVRVYVRCHSSEYEQEERQRIVQQITLTPDTDKQMWTQAQNLLGTQTTAEVSSLEQVLPTNKELWVDLYKPRQYLELLSDESTNRLLLRWLKLWDKVVFKRKPKPSNPKEQRLPHLELDESGRPFHKVALLCGPPGLGKTTLAHMVARHAGYNVVEVNASDDRSIDAFRKLLETATQMKSVVDAENRPNCVVFDEIDGAPASSIDFLVKFVTGTGRMKKNQKEKNVLKRPIICICNDVYVAALRPLRQVAFVVNFPPTNNMRLAERLAEIAKLQMIKTDMGTMLALAEKSHNDIRSCLAVLHFFKAQDKPVTLSDVHRASVGQKDIQKGLFAVWQDIFQIERADSTKHATLKQRTKKILDVVNSFGDYDKVAQGVFENYQHLDYKNSSMGETCWALDWFCYNDVVNQRVYASQNYTLTSYLPFAFVAWHFTFATRIWQKLHYPSRGYEVRMKQNRQKAITNELIRGIHPDIRSYVQRLSLVLDILPLLSIIIVPSFRPISLHLYTDEEKKRLDHVVNVMVDYNLNYVQERSADGTYEYKLDPNVDEVVSFGRKKTLSYSNKQLVAKEIETVKMHRLEARPTQSSKTSANSVPNHLQILKAKTVSGVETPAVAKDFFGRAVAKGSSSGKSTPSQEAKNDIWYRFKEGYNNAVRKKIKISSLK